MYLNSIVLGMIVLIVTIYFEKRRFKEKGFGILEAMIGCTVALIFLSFPLYEEYSGITRIVYSTLYAIQTLLLNEDFTLVEMVEAEGIINNIYICIMYIFYLGAPLLTATALLTLVGDIFSEAKLRISAKTEYHIFSQLNERTFTLANKILSNNKKAKIVFTNKENYEENTYRNRKFLKLKETINQLNLSKLNKKKYIYFMSDNENDNLNECLELLEKAGKNDEEKIYLLNSTQEAYIIIDSVLSQKYTKLYGNSCQPKIKVEIINEAERITLQRLNELPIQNIVNKETKQITVLIVGSGIYAKAFLNSIIWCFQIIGYSLKVIVIDENISNNICEDEVLKRYDIDLINKNMETVISEKLLENVEVNYAVVVAGTDTENFDIAISLRRYFLRKNKDVYIDVLIQNDYRSKNIDILKNEKNLEYNLNTFGSIEKEYSGNSILNSNIEKMSKKLHMITCPYDSNFYDFYKSEYNRKSSRATVVHMKYKLFSILLDEYSGNINEDISKYKNLITNEEIVRQLAQNEHDRWMAYMFTDGYRVATKQDVRNYYLKIGGNHKNTLAKLHPAMVENDMLSKASEDLANVIEELTGIYEKKNFVEFDYDIVRRLDEIVG